MFDKSIGTNEALHEFSVSCIMASFLLGNSGTSHNRDPAISLGLIVKRLAFDHVIKLVIEAYK